jgi:nitroreductase
MNTTDSPMALKDAILHRRSIRAFDPMVIDRATIQAALVAATWAPTAMHEEPLAFSVIQDAHVLRRLSDRAKALLTESAHRGNPHISQEALARYTDPHFNIFYDAGTLIVISAKPLGPYVGADCWLAAENLMLFMHGVGLGSCVIGLGVPILQDPHVKAELSIPPNMTAVVPIIVGKPHGDAPPSERKAPLILSWLPGERVPYSPVGM